MLVRKAIQIVSETMAAVEKVIRTISEAEAVVGKGSGDVEDMFVNDVGMHAGVPMWLQQLECECPFTSTEFRQVFGYA
ncbi:hypothetical protein TB2_022357 [Malus domestica]